MILDAFPLLLLVCMEILGKKNPKGKRGLSFLRTFFSVATRPCRPAPSVPSAGVQ